jgi:hypothetical protein
MQSAAFQISNNILTFSQNTRHYYYSVSLLLSKNVYYVKVKSALEQAMKAQRGSRGITVFFL